MITNPIQCPLAPSFFWHELVPESYYRKFEKTPEKFLNLFDDRALKTLQALREEFGPATVNNWAVGGSNQYRGWRPFNCTVGAIHSQHKFGRAFDVNFKHTTAEQARKLILANPHRFPHLTRIERDVSWLHFDVATTNSAEVKVIAP